MLGRFIRPQDLARFVADFLAHFDQRSELIEEDEPGVHRLDVSEKLLQFVIGQPEDSQKSEFCRKLHQKSLRITFDSAVAEKDNAITFLHVRHFFIRAIVEANRRGEAGLHPVALIGLGSIDGLPSGDYLYLLARATIRAAREQDALLPVIVALESLEPLEEDMSELCLGRMVHEGTDSVEPLVDVESCCRAYAVAESILVERFESRRANVERINQAFVDARLSSIRESYRLKISRKQALLDSARKRYQPPSYIRMLEGTIRNLTA